jgi:hypothetical protein
MQHTISHTIEIDAPPEVVWGRLADTAAYPDWNPFVRRLEGSLEEGASLEAEIAPPGGRPMTFKPTVLAARPNRELRWRGRLLLPGLFDGEHSFEIEPLAGGRSRLTQSERFSGLLVRALRRSLANTERGFEAMNMALKERAESAQNARRPALAGRL